MKDDSPMTVVEWDDFHADNAIIEELSEKLIEKTFAFVEKRGGNVPYIALETYRGMYISILRSIVWCNSAFGRDLMDTEMAQLHKDFTVTRAMLAGGDSVVN